MKIRNVFILFCCSMVGSTVISAHVTDKDNKNLIKSAGDSLLANSGRSLLNYDRREMNIRSAIWQMLPGTYLDSMGIVINLLNDSIRTELSKTKAKDSIPYLKTCLNNTTKDSILLQKLGSLSMDKHDSSNEMLVTHCMDASNLFPLDSVTMDLFSGNNLIASAMSDNMGIIRMQSVSYGTYSIVFSRRGYCPTSFIHNQINGTTQLCIDVSLSKQTSYLTRMISQNLWLSVVITGVLLLLSISILAYFFARFVVKKQKKIAK